MGKVYLVTTGSHSDYTPVAVFTRKEAAESYAKGLGWDANDPEEIDLGPPERPKVPEGAGLYSVRLDGFGALLSQSKIASSGQFIEHGQRWEVYNVADLAFRAFVFAESYPHAFEIVQALRVRLIQSGEFLAGARGTI